MINRRKLNCEESEPTFNKTRRGELSLIMLHFTSKLAMGKADDAVHQKLIKFSKGQFDGPVMEINIKGKILLLGGSAEYEDLIGWILAKYAPAQLEFKVTGSIKSPEDQNQLLKNIGFNTNMKKPKGKTRYEAKIPESVISAEQLKDLYSKLMEECTILLTIKPSSGGKEWSMTTKKDYPRPPTKGELKGPDTEFCKATLPAGEDIIGEALSEAVPDFKDEVHTPFRQLRVANHYRIDDVVLPDEKERLDFAEIRKKARRKGVLVRRAQVDGKEFTKEVEFCI